MFYRYIFKPVFFLFSAEKAHHMAMVGLKAVHTLPGGRLLIRWLTGANQHHNSVEVAGIRFPNRVGLAAGFDKNATAFKELSSLGFGFIEIGTVTPEPQPGNPKPRLFRLPDDEALINRMGFNNDGVLKVKERIQYNPDKVIIGGNIGKNKNTSNDDATSDYLKCFDVLYPFVNYFVVNISSPNTPGLRELQEKEPLKYLLNQIQELNRSKPEIRPVFLKVAPDLTSAQTDDIIEIITETKLAGIIVSNTTISREDLKTPKSELDSIGGGGLSGKPLKAKSDELLNYVVSKADKRFAIIASGGIMTHQDALDKINAGADLVQIYTGFIYAGPALISNINKTISKYYNTSSDSN